MYYFSLFLISVNASFPSISVFFTKLIDIINIIRPKIKVDIWEKVVNNEEKKGFINLINKL